MKNNYSLNVHPQNNKCRTIRIKWCNNSNNYKCNSNNRKIKCYLPVHPQNHKHKPIRSCYNINSNYNNNSNSNNYSCNSNSRKIYINNNQPNQKVLIFINKMAINNILKDNNKWGINRIMDINKMLFIYNE